MSKTKAEKIKVFIDEILEHQRYGTQPHKESEFARWLSGLSREMTDRLERVGLLTLEPPTKLGDFLAEYIRSRRKTLKVSSIIALEQSVRVFTGGYIWRFVRVAEIQKPYKLRVLDFSKRQKTIKPIGK